MKKNKTNKINNITKCKLLLIEIKSKYIIKKVFENLKTKKFLQIIKYNNRISKKIDISLKDSFKKFWIDNQIEIELNIIENPEYDEDKKNFINYEKEDEPYIHIHLNNDKKETKRNYINKNEALSTVKIILDLKFKKFLKLFCDCKIIKKIQFIKFKRDDIINMSEMFSGCENLTDLDLSNFNTDNVTDMEGMFSWSTKLTYLDLGKFNTKNVTNTRELFWGCWSLKNINLSSFNTDNIKNMKKMFDGCSSLIELDLKNFNTINVINMEEMFFDCSSIKYLNLKNFKTDNVNDMNNMFAGCSRLEELDISNFNFNKVRISENIFNCNSLKKVHIPPSTDAYIKKLIDDILNKSKIKKGLRHNKNEFMMGEKDEEVIPKNLFFHNFDDEYNDF